MATLVRILHALFMGIVLQPKWSYSVDILVQVYSSHKCLDPLVCTRDMNNHSLTIFTRIQLPTDIFTSVKTAQSPEGKLILDASLNSCLLLSNENTSNTSYDVCSLNCSSFFSTHKHVIVQRITLVANKSILYMRTNATKWDVVITAINVILFHVQWKNIIVFTPSGGVDISSRIQSTTKMLFTVEDVALNKTLETIYTQLHQEDLNFIAICSTKCIMELLHQAGVIESSKKKSSKWIISLTGDIDPERPHVSLPIKTTNVVLLEFNKYLNQHLTIDIASLLSRMSHLKDGRRMEYYKYIYDYIQKLPRNKSGVTTDIYVLHESNDNPTRHNVGHIRQDDRLVLTDELFPGMKYGLNNRTLIVTLLEVQMRDVSITSECEQGQGPLAQRFRIPLVLKWRPFVLKEEKNGSIIYSGICIDLIKELSRSLNFSYVFVEPEDQEFGRFLDGNWTGMVEMVANKKADLLLGPIAADPSREIVLDFTMPYYIERSAILLKNQNPNTNKWMTLVSPYRYEVHIGILVSLICSSVFLFLIEEAHPVNTWTNISSSARRTRYGDILWYHFGALMANGGAYLPSTQSGRSVLSCWWLFTVISAAIYSGNLIAFLTDWRVKPPFTSLAEMVEQDTYRWGTLGGSVYTNLFQNSSQPEYKKLWDVLETNSALDPDVMSVKADVHLQKVLAGQYAYIGDVSNLDLWKSKYCDLYMLHEDFFSMNIALGFPNDSLYTDLFSTRILRIVDSGLVAIWYKRWMPQNRCETSKTAKRVDVLALQGAFYAAGMGVALAFIVIVTENIYNKKFKLINSRETNTN